MNEETGAFQLPDAIHERLRPSSKGKRIAVLTGAGMSAESGIPTFRDAQHSLWSDYSMEALATPAAWRKNPARVWAWYEWRRHAVMAAEPNAGHLALAELEQQFDVSVFTQNVDDLHERAGSTGVVHLHGSLFTPHCFACRRPGDFAENSDTDPNHPAPSLEPPRCKHCGGKLRPGVVWFGEQLPRGAWQQAIQQVGEADLLVVIGTSGVVHPVAGLPRMALSQGVPILEINPKPVLADLDSSVTCWTGIASEGLTALRDSLRD